MANWSGTKTITTPGTTATGGTTTTMTNTGAAFTASCVGMSIRFLTGSNAGTVSIISAQTATQLTFAAVANAVVAGDTYEIVAILANGDHMTAALTFSTNTIVEMDNSGTFVSDGIFLLSFAACIVRLGKTETTLVTFAGNNRTVTGKAGFWSGITCTAAMTSTPQIQYMRIQDAATPMTLAVSSGLGNCSTVSKIWAEGNGTTGFTFSGTLTQNQTWQNLFINKSAIGRMTFQTGTWAFTETYKKMWVQDDASAGVLVNTAVNATQTVRDCVFNAWTANGNNNLGAGAVSNFQDCYIALTAQLTNGLIGAGNAGTGVGTYNVKRNVIFGSGILGNTVANASATMVSAFNDVTSRMLASSAYTFFPAAPYASATSDNDYISGQLLASPENIDTTNATTSTASPVQYKNFTAARTNAKSVFNRPYVIDNIVTGTPTQTQVAITFDCQNGAVAGQGSSTVNADSNSGQAVLSIPNTVGFDVGEVVEVGYGTARSESLEIASIVANTSLTFTTNLAFTHTAAQADTVKKTMRHIGVPHIKYGTATGVYTMGTQHPDRLDLGLIFTSIRNIVNGMTFTFAQTGHSLTLSNLNPGTTYFYVPYATTPTGDVCVGAEQTFTTASPAIGSLMDAGLMRR